MNIVHLTASRFLGGPERQMLELARTLAPHHRTTFISFAEQGLCRAFLEVARRSGFDGFALRYDTPRLVAAVHELAGALDRCGADVLCCHGYKAALLGRVAARRARLPVVAVSRGWTGQTLRVRLYEALDRVALRWTDRVICVSQAQAAKVRRAGVREDRIAVIRNAIRPERFSHLDQRYRRKLLELFPERPRHIVGAAGRLSPEKGFDVLVSAAAHVARANPSIGFVVFGDGFLRRSLERQAAELGLARRLIFAGFRSNFDDFLPHLDLLVNSSHTEGLPNVILEALAAAVPVVATRVGGTPEIVQDGAGGYLVPARDPGALAQGILAVLADEENRLAMGRRGRERVLSDFSFAQQGALYERHLSSVVAAARRNGKSGCG